MGFSDLRGLESFDGGDLGALVPTGTTFFFGSLNALHSAFEGRVDSRSLKRSVSRSDLRMIEAAVIVGVCEKSCSAPSSSLVKLPADSDASHGIIRALGPFSWSLMVIGIIVVLIAGVSWIYQAMTKSDQRSEN